MMLAYMTADVGAHHNRAWVLGHDVAGAWTSVHDLIASGTETETQPKAVVSDRSAESHPSIPVLFSMPWETAGCK
jgi:aldehyde:ferredoxin oxidoreductase